MVVVEDEEEKEEEEEVAQEKRIERGFTPTIARRRTQGEAKRILCQPFTRRQCARSGGEKRTTSEAARTGLFVVERIGRDAASSLASE